MKMRTATSARRLSGLGLAVAGVIVLSAWLLLAVGTPGTAEAAQQVTLAAGQRLTLKSDACSLEVRESSPTRVRVACPAEGVKANVASDDDSAVEVTNAQVGSEGKRKLAAGEAIKVLASSCLLNVKTDTPQKVVINCKFVPTFTPTPKPPTLTPTRAPAKANVFVSNYTGGTLCYEIQGTGIGQRCYGGGTEMTYGSFPAGTYRWSASAWCGSASSTFYFGPQNWNEQFSCGSGVLVASSPDGAH